MTDKPGFSRYRGVWNAASFSLFEAAALYPFVMLFALYALDIHPLLLLLLLGIVHVCGVLIGREQSRSGKARIGTPILMVIMLVLSLVIFGLRAAAAIAVLALLIAAIRGLIVGRKQLWKIATVKLPLIGLAASLVLYITAGNVEAMHPYRTSLYVMSMLTLFAFLLRLNGERVRDASHSEQADRQLFSRILSANHRMTWVVIIFIAVLSGWSGLGALFLSLRNWIRSLLGGTGGDGQPPVQTPEDPNQQPLPDLGNLDQGTTEQPMWLRVTGYVFLGILCLIVAILLGILLYKVFRRWIPEHIREWIRRLVRRLGILRSMQQFSEEQADFVDEVEKIDRVPAKSRKRRWLRKEPEYSGNDPRLAYQSLIRRAVKKGFSFRSSHTPAENGARLAANEELTGLQPEAVNHLIERYNVVRYGSREE